MNEMNMKPCEMGCMALALILIVETVLVGIMQVNMNTLRAANRDLAGAGLSRCAAVGVGDMAWHTIGPDGSDACLHFTSPPTRDQWFKRNELKKQSNQKGTVL